MRYSLALSVSGVALVACIFAGQTDHALAQSSDDVAIGHRNGASVGRWNASSQCDQQFEI